MNVPTKPGCASVEIHGNFVDGREIEAGSGTMLDVRNPATGEVIAQIPNSTADDIGRAMKSALTVSSRPSPSPTSRDGRQGSISPPAPHCDTR